MMQLVKLKIWLVGLGFCCGLWGADQKVMTQVADSEYKHYGDVRLCAEGYLMALNSVFDQNGWSRDKNGFSKQICCDRRGDVVIPVVSRRVLKEAKQAGPILKILPDGAALETAWGRWLFVSGCPVVNREQLLKMLERVMELHGITENSYVITRVIDKPTVQPVTSVTEKGLKAGSVRLARWKELTDKYNWAMYYSCD